MYTMSYFFDQDQTLRIAKGDDLFHFQDCNQNEPVLDLRPFGKIIRDPYILKDQQGIYRLFFTDNWYSNTLGYTTSLDLLHWEPVKHLKVMGDNDDVNCWAPELCFDHRRNAWMLFWSTEAFIP